MRRFAMLLAVPVVLQLTGCNIIPYDRGARANEPLCSDIRVLERNARNWGLCHVDKKDLVDDASRSRLAKSISPPSPVLKGKEVIDKGELPGPEGGKVFVGIAISGGGSRAANFSLASMLELGSAGLLDHVAAISSVSGGSLTNAYYSLYSGSPLWTDATGKVSRARSEAQERLKNLFREDMQNTWEGRWLLPQNVVRYWLTPYDRSDIMKGVINEFLATQPQADDPAQQSSVGRMPFNQLGKNCVPPGECALPRTYFNATTIDGRNFVFSQERFFDLGSRLDTFPVADAVMASAAFPGGFNKVTVERYRSLRAKPTAPQSNIRQGRTQDRDGEAIETGEITAASDIGYDVALEALPDADPSREPASPLEPQTALYLHLMDGGASDNLGVRTLIRTLQATREPVEHCALILIDSFTDPLDRKWSRLASTLGIFKDDPRGLTDYIVDSSAVTAFDTLLSNNRENMLRELNYPAERVGQESYWVTNPLRDRQVVTESNRDLSCHVWHLSFQRLRYLPENTCVNDLQRHQMARLADETVTAFRLDSPGNHDAAYLQDNLFKVAQCLVNSDASRIPPTRFAREPGPRGEKERDAEQKRSVGEFLTEQFNEWGIGRK